MTIEKITNGTELTVKLAGRLDTTTAPELEAALKDSYAGVEKLVLDFAELEYLSSAGLRVLLQAQKTMNKQGEMIVKNIKLIKLSFISMVGVSFAAFSLADYNTVADEVCV